MRQATTNAQPGRLDKVRRRLFSVGSGLAAVALYSVALHAAQKPAPTTTGEAPALTPVARFAGASRGLTVEAGVAYIGAGGKLAVVDVAKPASPVLLGEVALPRALEAVAVTGGFAYVAAGSAGLQVVDVRDKAHPKIAGTYDVRKDVSLRRGQTTARGRPEATSVTVAGGRVYLGFDDGELHILDVSEPSRPRMAGVHRTPDKVYGLTVVGARLYLANFEAGLHILDVTDPARLVEIGTFPTKWSQEVAVVGTRAYVADGPHGLRILDMADPAKPKELGSYAKNMRIPYGARHVVVVGSMAYVANRHHGLHIVDVSDPAAPKEVGYYKFRSWAYGLGVKDGIAYLADYSDGLDVVDVSDPAKAQSLAAQSWGGSTTMMVFDGDLAYLPFSRRGFSIYDVRDPRNPRELSTTKVPGSAYGVAVRDKVAFIAAFTSGLQVFDVADPRRPTLIGGLDMQGSTSQVVLAGPHAYVTAGDKGLRVIDVSNPRQPREVGVCPTTGSSSRVLISGRYAYVSDGYEGVSVCDVQDPTHPVLIGSTATPPGSPLPSSTSPYERRGEIPTRGSVNSLAIEGNYLYAAASDRGLRVFTLNGPTALKEVAAVERADFSYDVRVSGKYAILAQGHDGFYIIDVSDPAKPREAAHYPTPGNCWGLGLYKDFLFVSDGTGGLIVYEGASKLR
jgi:hypothetical protein